MSDGQIPKDEIATRCERAEAALARIAERHGFETGRQAGDEVTDAMIAEIDAWIWDRAYGPHATPAGGGHD